MIDDPTLTIVLAVLGSVIGLVLAAGLIIYFVKKQANAKSNGCDGDIEVDVISPSQPPKVQVPIVNMPLPQYSDRSLGDFIDYVENQKSIGNPDFQEEYTVIFVLRYRRTIHL